MLNFEECKEVAEKLWGWHYVAGAHLRHGGYWTSERNSRSRISCHIEWIKHEVNSWEGFGRTVEAMEEKGYYLSTNVYQCFGFYKRGRVVATIDLGGCSFEWAERTHRAAIEAVKEAE